MFPDWSHCFKLPSMPWCCWLDERKDIRPVKNPNHLSPKMVFWINWRNVIKGGNWLSQAHLETCASDSANADHCARYKLYLLTYFTWQLNWSVYMHQQFSTSVCKSELTIHCSVLFLNCPRSEGWLQYITSLNDGAETICPIMQWTG